VITANDNNIYEFVRDGGDRYIFDQIGEHEALVTDAKWDSSVSCTSTDADGIVCVWEKLPHENQWSLKSSFNACNPNIADGDGLILKESVIDVGKYDTMEAL